MSHLPTLIADLALILISASIITLLFKWLKQPLVLGYIIAGLLAGPYINIFPTVGDIENINIWAEIGVIFLLFALGLEFSFKKLMNVGSTAFITAITEVISMLLIGYLVGQLLGWGTMNSIFLCLLVSGGNSQIILVKAYNDMEILGQTIDDAAGEAIDKCSKVMGLGYPGGPIIDRLARQGNPKAFTFSKPHIPGLDYSFSGLKTSFLYSLRDWIKDDPDFIEHHKTDLAASLEATVVDILMDKLRKAAKQYKIKDVAVAGGVSANNGLRNSFREHAEKYGWNIFIPKFSYTTDNAAMIAITGYFKYLDKDFCPMEAPAYSRVTL